MRATEPEIFVALMAAIGGSMRYFYDNKKRGAPFNIAEFIIKIITCVFIGFSAYSAAVGLGCNFYLSLAASNLCSWLGVESINFVWDIVQRYCNTKFPPIK